MMFHKMKECRHEGRRFARGGFGRGDFEGRHGGGFGGGGRGGRRFFGHGDLRLVVLGLIAEKPRHGYELIKAIEEALGGQYSPSPGVVYPTLTLLEELGHATVAESAEGKKLYAITPAGQAFLAANKGMVDALFARMGEVRAIHGDGPPAPILRAMENLKLALRLKLGRGRPDEAAIRTMAEAIDAAAQAVERA
ncbi:PadR family transcriptional regulator [Zavarzinia sp.]|uniref:PadR family transcriptional regulator n=1 Tax=Zavarzinia sp. TaxID=2027920 RepID=UPI003566AE1F